MPSCSPTEDGMGVGVNMKRIIREVRNMSIGSLLLLVQEGYAAVVSSWARIYFMTFYVIVVVCI